MAFIQGKYRCINCFEEKNNADSVCACGFVENNYICEPHCLQPGTLLNNVYCVGRVLGEGGFGITYSGFDLNLEMRVAIKEFYMNGYNNRDVTVSNDISSSSGNMKETFEQNRDKFIDEARTLAKFNNEPGVVSVLNFFRVNNTAYIIMEFLDGKNLKQYIADSGNMPVNEVIRLFMPVIQALGKVHSANLMHRDISPDNIIYTNTGELKLLDFGATREISKDDRSLSVILKHGYSPLEQYQSHGNQGPWTDVYALCATMYKCITGVTPPEGPNRAMGERVIPICEMVASCPRSISDVISKGMEFNIENRYRSMEELAYALNCAIRTNEANSNGYGVPIAQQAPANYGAQIAQQAPANYGGPIAQQVPANCGAQVAQQAPANCDEARITAKSVSDGDNSARTSFYKKIIVACCAVVALLMAVLVFVLLKTVQADNENETGRDSVYTSIKDADIDEEIESDDTDIGNIFIRKRENAVTEAESSEEEDLVIIGQDDASDVEPQKVEGRIKVQNVGSTSFLNVQSVDNATYGANNLIDGRYDTPWCEGDAGLGIGQSFTLYFGEEKEITSLVIYNGFLQTKYRYSINGRVTCFEIAGDYGFDEVYNINTMYVPEEKVGFASDERGETKIEFDSPIRTSYLTFVIASAEPGTKYQDVMVSEVEVYGFE